MNQASTSTSTSPSDKIPPHDEEYCIICLQDIVDRTLLPDCGHNYTCFQCIWAWITCGTETLKARRCPLCNTPIGSYIVHNVRGEHDFQRHWIPPAAPESKLFQGPAVTSRIQGGSGPFRLTRARPRRNVHWGGRLARVHNELDELEKAIERRRHIYRCNLYAKHVASNRHTRYKPYPTPAHIAASQELCSRTLKFVRRELRVWEGLDIEFLTQYIISLLRTMDLRSERAIALLSEFVDNEDVWIPDPPTLSRGYNVASDVNTIEKRHKHAEHFAHELYSYLRSPFTDLTMWDRTVQYDKSATTKASWSPPNA